jgi:protein-L-isoaspartate(D-aspartate) O-methyltransferase
MDEDARYTLERYRMVDEQIRRRDIRDERVLQAMRLVPRHRFVAPEHRDLAYTDGPLPIGSRPALYSSASAAVHFRS